MSMAAASRIKVVPSASRLIHSLRDLGYDFPQAVADLVDNSIAAGARKVAVDLRFDGPNSWLRICDDGHGMDARAINEAMRYGSQQSYDEEDLGKFGLGLKTASLSQCRRLSVASRNGSARASLEARVLDLDHVMLANRWEILAPRRRTLDERLVGSLAGRSGTTVLWESLDRVLGYKIPSGKRARSAVDHLAQQLQLHLGMVFHRFIAGEVPERPAVRILVNGRRIPPWDPFARTEPSTIVLAGRDIPLRTSDGVGLVRFQPYVLPPRDKFSSDEEFHRMAGPRMWNAQQGMYIYRAHRMIQSGGWSRIRALDEHVKLARASIDFFPELDSAFEINVAKVRVVLPAELREKLREPIERLVRSAQSRYRDHSPTVHPNGEHEPSTDKAWLRRALEDAAGRVGETRALCRILTELEQSKPSAARQLGLLPPS